MKALKYGLTLMLGLSMLGWNTRVQAQEQQVKEQPQRGTPLPQAVEVLMENGNYETAVKEFEKFIKTAKGNPCDLIYLPMSFYMRLIDTDTSKTESYKDKVDFYFDQYMKTCGNTAEAYLLKNARMESQNFDSTVLLMTQAIALDPTYANLYFTRGSALWQLQQTEKACADYKKAKELDASYANNYDMQCVELKEAAEPAPVE